MKDEFEFTLHSPLTKEDWNKISDAEHENTMFVTFQTPQGRQVKYIKCEVLDKLRAEIEKQDKWLLQAGYNAYNDGTRECCKDCKYFEYDSVAKVDGVPLIVAHEICNRWGDGCKTREDGFCFLFEPQESEDE